jgi:ABC-2 type transport system permease protein
MNTTTTPTAAVLRTEGRLFSRELGSLFWIVLFPTALLSVLGAIPSFREPDAVGSQRVVDLYVPVSVLLSMIMAAVMAMPPVLNGYRERGILRRLRTTPMHPASILLAQVALHAAAVVASAVLVIAVGRVVFDVPLPASILGYAVAFVLALVAAFSIGTVITAVSPGTRAGQTIGTIVFFPSMFTAGVYVPVQSLTGALHDVVVLTPMGAAAEALNDSLLGHFPDLLDLGVMAGWTAVLALLAVRFFRWE